MIDCTSPNFNFIVPSARESTITNHHPHTKQGSGVPCSCKYASTCFNWTAGEMIPRGNLINSSPLVHRFPSETLSRNMAVSRTGYPKYPVVISWLVRVPGACYPPSDRCVPRISMRHAQEQRWRSQLSHGIIITWP